MWLGGLLPTSVMLSRIQDGRLSTEGDLFLFLEPGGGHKSATAAAAAGRLSTAGLGHPLQQRLRQLVVGVLGGVHRVRPPSLQKLSHPQLLLFLLFHSIKADSHVGGWVHY